MFDELVHVGNAHGFTLETGRLKGLRYALQGGKAAVGKPFRDFDKQAGVLPAHFRRHFHAGGHGGGNDHFVRNAGQGRRSASSSIKLP